MIEIKLLRWGGEGGRVREWEWVEEREGERECVCER